MKGEKQKATAGTMAPGNKLHNRPYRNYAQRSRAKLKREIGELLLCLQTPFSQSQRQEYWRLFEARLRRYVDLKVGGATV